MASPQLEDGFLKISNELFEAIIMATRSLTRYELMVFMAIVRLTYGYNKKEKQIKGKEIELLTNILPNNISRAKKMLVERNMIEIDNGNIRIQKDYELWKTEIISRQIHNSISPDTKKVSSQILSDNEQIVSSQIHDSIQPDTLDVSRQIHNSISPDTFPLESKYNLKDKYKYNSKNKELFDEKADKPKREKPKLDLPSWIDLSTWHDYLEMRRKIRKPATLKAQELIIKKLERLKSEGQDPNKILEQSIENSWQGVFPLKEVSEDQDPELKRLIIGWGEMEGRRRYEQMKKVREEGL